MIRFKFLLVTLLVITLAPCFGEITGQDSLVVYVPLFAPYWEQKRNQEVVGYHARATRAIYERAGLKVRFKALPYPRLIENLKRKRIKLLAVGIDPRLEPLLLQPIPKTEVTLKIYSFTENPPTVLDQLKSEKIVISRGYPLAQFENIKIDRDYNVHVVNDLGAAVQFFVSGRAKYLILYAGTFEYELNQVKYPFGEIFSATLAKFGGYPIAVVKGHPDSNELSTKIKNAFDELLKEGIISMQNDILFLKEDLDIIQSKRRVKR